MAVPLLPDLFRRTKDQPLLSFSTLGCPDWNFLTIVDFAARNQYDGIELRGILREMDLTKCPEFSPSQLPATLSLLKDRHLSFVDLGASATLHLAPGPERTKNLDEAKRFIDLGQKINCPHVRVFPNNFPKDQQKEQTLELITNGLLELGEYAKGSNVSVLVETHGDLVWAADILKVMQAAYNEHTGLVWDVTNMWSVTREPPAEVYNTLRPYIRHTHIKDLQLKEGKQKYVLLGKGEVPIFAAVDALRKGGYKGYYSFEWEKLWHPEIEAPEVALADYPKVMTDHFRR